MCPISSKITLAKESKEKIKKKSEKEERRIRDCAIIIRRGALKTEGGIT